MTETLPNTPITKQARGQIRLGIQRLASKYSFHAAILERFEIRNRESVGTMAVTTAGLKVLLLFNSDFVLGITLDQLVGVLLHEVHHVVFGHLLLDPTDYPDAWALTVAEEITVNEFITEPLPGTPIRLQQFPRFPSMESTDERYHRLKNRKQRLRLSPLSVVLGGTGDEKGEASGSKDGQSKSGGNPKSGTIIDDHSVWMEVLSDRDQAESAIRAVLQDAVSEVESDQVPGYLHSALHRRSIGSLNGEDEYQLRKDSQGELDWRHLLRRYVASCLSIQPDFGRPSRRLPELVGVIPGKRRRGTRPRVMAAVDTSASITPELLEQISAELQRLAGDYEVLVVECDAEIQRVYRYRPLDSVLGRGGTDLRPPLESDFLRRHRIDLAVYFTDGFGDAPEKSPCVPVVWCLTEDGERPAEWGREIRMSGLDSPKSHGKGRKP